MTIAAFVYAAFKAISAIPQILGILRDIASGVTLWFVENANEKTRQEIADAAAFAARAQSPEDRKIALDKWRAALSRSRYST